MADPFPRLARRIAAALDTALDGALPQRCAACAAALRGAAVLCPTCTAAIPTLSLSVCARCLAAGREPVGCRAHAQFAVWPAWVYDRRVECLVHALKFEGRPAVARGLVEPLRRAAAPIVEIGGAHLVTEVPLHRARRRERGYNQAALLAEVLAGAIGAPHVTEILERPRATRAQAQLGARARRDNLAGAFRVPHPERVRGREVVVVDDVITSGATLEACLEALAEAGARPVAVTLAWAQ